MIRALPVWSPKRELQARAAQLVVGHLRAARSARLRVLKHTFMLCFQKEKKTQSTTCMHAK
jgi:hypothetical protein